MLYSSSKLLELLLIDLALSIDNLLAIYLVTKSAKAEHKSKIINNSILLAIASRVLLVFFYESASSIAIIKGLGGLFLIYIALKLLFYDIIDNSKAHSSSNIYIRIILIDCLMALDNVIAVVELSNHNNIIIFIAIAISISMLKCGLKLVEYLKAIDYLLYPIASVLIYKLGFDMLFNYIGIQQNSSYIIGSFFILLIAKMIIRL